MAVGKVGLGILLFGLANFLLSAIGLAVAATFGWVAGDQHLSASYAGWFFGALGAAGLGACLFAADLAYEKWGPHA